MASKTLLKKKYWKKGYYMGRARGLVYGRWTGMAGAWIGFGVGAALVHLFLK